MNTYQLCRSIKYYTLSRHKNGHGIHSPFVFELINLVLKRPLDKTDKRQIHLARKRLCSRHELIKVNDLGSGPVNSNNNMRKLSSIVKNTAVRPAYGKVLYNLAKMNNGHDILEMGTSSGISTLYISRGAPLSQVITIEGCSALSNIAAESFHKNSINNVEIINGNFDEKLEEIISSGFKPKVVFIDGNHRKAPTLSYFNFLLEHLCPESIIIFDDIYYSADMENAWNEIKSNPRVSVSIDIFQMGLIFLRAGMIKQNYIIRY